MTWAAVLGTYFAGWVLASAREARRLAESEVPKARCHGEMRSGLRTESFSLKSTC